MNSASIVMQVLGLLVESVPGGQASTMVFYTNSLKFCSRTMRLNGGEGLHEALNNGTAASSQFYGCPLDQLG